MMLSRRALENPVAVVVGVLLAVIFGALALSRLPVQLTPEVERPEIAITTAWPGAAPQEVEAEIVEPQEDALRGVPGMTELLAQAKFGSASITLTFAVGTDMRRALLEVMSRLNRVPRYPAEAEEPVISTASDRSQPIAWFIIKPAPGNERPIASYQSFIEDTVQTRFERIPGVARSEVRGGREEEIRITFDPYALAAFGLELPEVLRRASGAEDRSGGDHDVGRRSYTLRFAGRYSLAGLEEMVLAWHEGRPVRLRDVARVERTLAERASFVIQNGEPAMAVNAYRETGVNVLQVMAGLQAAAEELRQGPLARAGLTLTQVYDETRYIHRAIDLLSGNLLLGVALAIGVLWWFLRRLRATLIVALSIPICLISSFLVMELTGRTLNVISLAGLAFAVGMVLDAAIIVLENIVRLRERGEEAEAAALQGTGQVWGALLASTATTVAIFLPVVFMEEEAGQLFADLALTLAAAIVLSLLVAITVVPAAARGWLTQSRLEDPHARWWQAVTRSIMRLSATPGRRWAWVVGLTGGAVGFSLWWLPPADYLPQGNRNLVFAFILPPPGQNLDTLEREMGQVVARRMAPYVAGEREPRINDYFFVAFEGGAFMGARAVDPARTPELVPLINRLINGFPGTLAFAKRSSLFGRFGAGRSIDVDLQGGDLEALMAAGRAGFSEIRRALPGASVRPFPELALSRPELRLIPREDRIAEVGWDRATVGALLPAFGDGVRVGEWFDGTRHLDVRLQAEPWRYPEDLLAQPLVTPEAGVVPLGELVELRRTAGPKEIRRIDRRRTVTLQVTPPESVSLEEALVTLQQQVGPKLAQWLPEDGDIRYAGSADELARALDAMGGNFLLALVILYLLMSALFRSFRDSLLVLFTIPLATVGGVIALKVVNQFTFQPLDLLTMIGFIILLGLVVNNAILLVHQTRAGERAGLGRDEAVAEAVRMRLRPIFMSTLTSLFGMLPLALIPGAGSELYRGLAAVIVGGLALSTVFTLLLLPSLLRMGRGARPV